MSTILRNLFAVLAILSLAPAAPAAVHFSETFSYTDGPLGSEPPDGGVSGGLWTRTGGAAPVTVSNAKVTLFYFPAPSQGIVPEPEDAYRQFSALTAGQTVYAGLDVSASGNTATAGVFGPGIWFASFSGSLIVTDFTGSDFTFGIGNGFSPTASWASGLTFGTTYRLVTSYEFDTGISKLWINPASELSTYVSFTNTPSRGVSAFYLHQGKTPFNTPPATQVLDNLVVGTTFDDVLTIPAPTLPGDFNLDGIVDAADYVVWRHGLGTIYTQTDYDVWRAHFGQSTGSGSALPSAESLSAAVPEPATFALVAICLAAAGVLNLRRGRRSVIRGNQAALLTVLAMVAVESAAPAAVLFSETFSYPDGHLASAHPDGGVSGGLWTMYGRPHWAVDVSNNKVTLLQLPLLCPGCGQGGGVQRDFSVLAAGQTIYAGFDVSAAGYDSPAVFAHFGWPDTVYGFRLGTALAINPLSGSDFTFRFGNGPPKPWISWASGLTFGTTYRVVMSWEFDTGNSKLWVNPASESSTSISATGFASYPVSAFALRQNFIGLSSRSSTQVLDNLVVGTTFDDVLAIPAPTLPGDFNLNCTVEAADYVVWRNGLGTAYTENDYNTWRANFGTMAGSGSGASANVTVPEPATLMLLVFTAASWSLRRRRTA